MRAVRALLFLPVLVLISPVLLVLGVIILVAETRSGALRGLFVDEVRAYGLSKGFGRFMQKVFVPAYKHHVQSFVLGAAGVLVVTVGLRGLGVLPVEIVYLALALEFTLLVLWAITVFYTEEEEITENGKALAHQTVADDGSAKLIASIRELNTQMALLENRLRATEEHFRAMGSLNGSLQEVATRLNSLMGDQFNARVKQEFDKLLAELGRRVSGNDRSAE